MLRQTVFLTPKLSKHLFQNVIMAYKKKAFLFLPSKHTSMAYAHSRQQFSDGRVMTKLIEILCQISRSCVLFHQAFRNLLCEIAWMRVKIITNESFIKISNFSAIIMFRTPTVHLQTSLIFHPARSDHPVQIRDLGSSRGKDRPHLETSRPQHIQQNCHGTKVSTSNNTYNSSP